MYNVLEHNLSLFLEQMEQDIEEITYWMIKMGEWYITLVRKEIELLDPKEWPKTRFKVPAHKLKRYRRYIKKVEEKIVEICDDEWIIKWTIKWLSTPLIQILVDLWSKDYWSYFDRFLVSRENIKKKQFVKQVNKLVQTMRSFQEANGTPEDLDLTMPTHDNN